ncbi:MAG: hypothetical protein HZR80_12350 [Candidatus Heimdallarchaeota archaeon]
MPYWYIYEKQNKQNNGTNAVKKCVLIIENEDVDKLNNMQEPKEQDDYLNHLKIKQREEDKRRAEELRKKIKGRKIF